MSKRLWAAGILFCLPLLGGVAAALPLPPAAAPQSPSSVTLPAWPSLPAGSSGAPWTIVVLLTVLTLLPALLLAMTPFVRLLVIFHFLRQALGTNTIPTNQTLIGLSLFLTWFLMAPVGTAIYQNALVPLQAGSIDAVTAVERGSVPVRDFMVKYAREKDLALFVELAHEPRPQRPQDLSMRVVVPAYMISELKTGFQIGAVLFIPFLVIDMAVASITTSVGMMQLPPVVISTPLKILVFVMADGWHLLVGAIMKSFY
jgi:flagellar biosynthetic protein FliP